MTQRSLDALTREECFKLLREERIGRLAYTDGLGPIAIPVNYSLAGECVVLRMERGNTVLPLDQSMLAFEADHIDADAHSGWSVVVRGPGRELSLPDVPALLRKMPGGPPHPWAEGIHNVWIEISPEVVTGRRLGRTVGQLVM
jgi:uncharacterized protein